MTLKPILILGGIILILIVVLGSTLTKLKLAKVERDQAVQYSLAKDDSLEYLTTTLGQVTSRSQVLDLTIRNLERLGADRELAWISEIRAINKRLNNVEQISTTTARVTASLRIPLQDTVYRRPRDRLSWDSLRINDDVTIKTFAYNNEWYSVSGQIFPDTLLFDFETKVPLQSVVYWQKRKGLFGLRWFGRKEWFKETKSNNPHVTITEDKLIRVSKRKRK